VDFRGGILDKARGAAADWAWMFSLSDRYIGRQVIYGTLFTVVLLSLVLVLGNLLREVRPLLVEQRAPLGLVIQVVLNIVPFSLMFTIPWGFLASVLLVFGRLSLDNELHGFRMAGMSLWRLAAPVFGLGVALSGLCLWLNVRVVPHARGQIEDMLFELARSDPRALLDPGVVQSRFRNQKVFVERKDGETLHGFHLYQVADPGARRDDDEPPPQPAYVHAGKVALVVDEERQNLRLTLTDAYLETWREDGTPELAFSTEAEPWLFDFSATRFRKPRAAAMDNRQILDFLEADTVLNEVQRAAMRSEIVRRYSLSMACFALAFIGVPLGINSRRTDTSSGLALSLVIGGGYFLFSLLSNQWHGASETATNMLLWAPNVLCVALGLWLMRRARSR
jgi:lipopolysaccharide export system permease protein